jgi:uncharacterized membrane protein YphA (DoxX/SURF4 family)
MLVVLRLALGWHFLYEGVWKVTHRDQFVAETEGFLSAARGPACNFFYSMVPDIDGHTRLEKELAIVEVKDPDGKSTTKAPRLARYWDEIRQRFVGYYRPIGGSDDKIALHKNLEEAAQKVYERHVRGLDEFIHENGDKITAHFEALHRFGEEGKTAPNTDFMRQRRWDKMQEFRKEAKGWIADLDSREQALKADLLDLVSKDRVSQLEIGDKKSDTPKAKEADAKKADAAPPAEDKSKAKETPKAKTADVKASDAPKDKKETKAKAKESAESGKEEADKAEDAKKTPEEAKKTSGDGKKPDAAGAKPQLADKAKDDAKDKPTKSDAAAKPAVAVDVMLIDYSPLAEGRGPEGPFAPPTNPLKWKKIEQMAGALSYVFLAIGLCLMLGLFTRLAALGGACFMLFVVFAQPSYPGVYPLDPPQLGHALLVNKDFVEMIALLVIASTRLSRWTGLDYFVYNCCVRPFCGNCE